MKNQPCFDYAQQPENKFLEHSRRENNQKSKMVKGYFYILECADSSYYTGSTKNIELRFAQHQNGEGANYTRKKLPVKLVFIEEFERIDEAYLREKQVQGWSRKKKKALISNNWDKLHKHAECKNESHFNNYASTTLSKPNDDD